MNIEQSVFLYVLFCFNRNDNQNTAHVPFDYDSDWYVQTPAVDLLINNPNVSQCSKCALNLRLLLFYNGSLFLRNWLTPLVVQPSTKVK